jgi:hypothetical protein
MRRKRTPGHGQLPSSAFTVDLTARRRATTVEVAGAIPVVFADYGIPNPSFGPVSTDDHGELEFLVVFSRS